MAKEDRQANERNRILEKDSKEALYEAMALCKTETEHRAFLTDLCTQQEIDALAERWVIARLLHTKSSKGNNMSYRDISSATGASTTTVGRVAGFLKKEQHQGYSLILERIESEKNQKDDTTIKRAKQPPP